MLKKIHLIIISILFITIISSCKKDSNGNLIIPGLNTSMSAKVNNVDWSSAVRVCTKSNNTITLTGTSADGQIITLTISPTLATDSLNTTSTYSLSLTTLYKLSATASANDIYAATSGSAKFTQLDKTQKLISGTFSFTGLNSSLAALAITAGTFSNVSYVGN